MDRRHRREQRRDVFSTRLKHQPGALAGDRDAARLHPPSTQCGCPPTEPRFLPFNETVEAFRAWQRKTGDTDPPLYQFAGLSRPPNWFGWTFVCAPFTTLVPPGSTGVLVIADGQNVVITGGGCATITQAFSV